MVEASSLSRMLAVLDVFSRERPVWTAEAIAGALGYSRPTGYRYVKELVEAGLLRRLGPGLYSLGARIIHLDYLLRGSDPVLQLAVPEMRELARRTGCDCVLSGLYGDQLLDTHRESASEGALQLAYGRGRLRPLFQGAAPKVILAALPTARLKALWEANAATIAGLGLGADWPSFRAAMREIRKRGYAVSIGELEPQLAAIAAPIGSDDAVVAAVALVAQRERFALLDQALLAKLVAQCAERVTYALGRLPAAAG